MRRAGFENGRAGWIYKAGRVGWISKKNQLRQNGDLTSLDFVVNDIEQRILLFRGFVETLNPVVVIFCKPGISSFPRTGQSAVFSLSKKTKQIDRFE